LKYFLFRSTDHLVFHAPRSIRNLNPNESSKAFDVILIDNHMPRMNGTTATQEMRRRGYAGVIIGITGDDDELTKQEFLTAGANGCLVKPISHDGLVACLATHLKFAAQIALSAEL